MTNENELSVCASNDAVASGARISCSEGLFLFYLNEVFFKIILFLLILWLGKEL